MCVCVYTLKQKYVILNLSFSVKFHVMLGFWKRNFTLEIILTKII